MHWVQWRNSRDSPSRQAQHLHQCGQHLNTSPRAKNCLAKTQLCTDMPTLLPIKIWVTADWDTQHSPTLRQTAWNKCFSNHSSLQGKHRKSCSWYPATTKKLSEAGRGRTRGDRSLWGNIWLEAEATSLCFYVLRKSQNIFLCMILALIFYFHPA